MPPVIEEEKHETYINPSFQSFENSSRFNTEYQTKKTFGREGQMKKIEVTRLPEKKVYDFRNHT